MNKSNDKATEQSVAYAECSYNQNLNVVYEALTNLGIMQRIGDKELFYNALLEAICQSRNRSENETKMLVREFISVFHNTSID